jgi:hypothetical protein
MCGGILLLRSIQYNTISMYDHHIRVCWRGVLGEVTQTTHTQPMHRITTTAPTPMIVKLINKYNTNVERVSQAVVVRRTTGPKR